MRIFRKYFFIAWLSGRSNLAYLGEIYSRILFMSVILYIFLQLWRATYSACGVERLGDLTLPQMLWYLTITEAIMLSAPRVTQQVDEDVRTGAIAMKLVRPLSYPLAILSANLGERIVRFALNLFAGSVVTFIMVGSFDVSAFGFLALAASLPLAFAIDFLGCFLIGLAAFWLEDTSGIYLIYSRLSMVLGGMLLPLELFPNWVRPLLDVLPFPNVVYGPAHQFLNPNLGGLLTLLLRQCLSTAGFALAIALVWRLAMKRVFANGG